MSRAPGWPVELRDGDVELRPLRLRDAPAWVAVRMRNEAWLAPWEATPEASRTSWSARNSTAVFIAMVRRLRREAGQGRCLPFAITYRGGVVGQLTIGNIVRGAFNSAYAGYWVDSAVAGRGITPVALALAIDHCFGAAALHRVEVNIRPENAASLRVAEKLGLRRESLHERYLAIDGAYRDHVGFAITREEVAPASLLARWKLQQLRAEGALRQTAEPRHTG